ncbi:MAG: PadR family transcriptional regulator [Cryobacterium sp.]|nr:PadR family transcriptional regulator [Cryobacterium sp.]
MHDSKSNRRSGSRGPGGFGGSHLPNFNIWETVDGIRSEFERQVGRRMGRGDVRSAILSLLVEKPMHGYQIIQEIEARSDGGWKPSAGSVYPTLQLLADEGVVQVEEAEGRKIYSLTEAGKAEAKASGDAPWEGEFRWDSKLGALPRAGAKLAHVIGAVAREGSAEQVEEAVALIDETRRKLHAILAKD